MQRPCSRLKCCAGFGAVQTGDIANDREDRAATASGVGRCKGRQDQIGQGDRIAQPQRIFAQGFNQPQGKALAQAGLGVTQRKHEGGEDQPHGCIYEATEDPLDGFTWQTELGIGQLLRS